MTAIHNFIADFCIWLDENVIDFWDIKGAEWFSDAEYNLQIEFDGTDPDNPKAEVAERMIGKYVVKKIPDFDEELLLDMFVLLMKNKCEACIENDKIEREIREQLNNERWEYYDPRKEGATITSKYD